MMITSRACRLLLLSFVLLWSLSSPLLADEPLMSFQTARMLGRGGAYVGAPETDASARFNPATLATSNKTFQLRILELNGVVSKNFVDTVNEISDTGLSSSDSSGPFIDLMETIDDKFGKRHYAHLELMPLALRFGPVEIMPFATNTSYLEARRPSVPVLYLNTDTRAGLLIGAGYSLFSTLDLGVSVKPMQRIVVKGEMAFTDILDLSDGAKFDDYGENTKGFGVGVDLAAVWRPMANFRWGVTIENVGDMGYLQDPEDPPSPIQQKISTGIWYRYTMATAWDVDLSFDWQDMENRQGHNLLRQLHMGAELGRSLFTADHDVGVLVGLGQGYPSWGAFLDAWFMRLEVAQHTAELGTLPGQRPDQRYSVSLRSSMSF